MSGFASFCRSGLIISVSFLHPEKSNKDEWMKLFDVVTPTALVVKNAYMCFLTKECLV